MRKFMKRMFGTAAATLALALALQLPAAASVYTVKAGDTLWKIATANGLTVSQLKEYSGQAADLIYIGQRLSLAPAAKHVVKSGDTLWLIAQRYQSTVAQIKSYNYLSSDVIYPSQLLYIPKAPSKAQAPKGSTTWPSVTYTVKAGDTVSGVAVKFGVTQADILKYNYMTADQWLNEGQKIAINGYAPRSYAVQPGESAAPARVGKLVDWFLDGQYLIKRNAVFTVTDVQTGLAFKAKMMGGVNHADIEPMTAADTAVMKKLFPTWVWAPRPVVVFHQGINFAASLSGMPHSFDSVPGNNVTGHFDLYLYNSKPHDTAASTAYVQQHAAAVRKAAGLK